MRVVAVDERGPERERDLLAAARAGEQEAFGRLVDPYRRELHVHCYRMLRSFHAAEDVLQDTMLRAWRHLDGFTGSGSFRGWLYRIATNACLSARRSRSGPEAEAAVVNAPEMTYTPSELDLVPLEPYPDALPDRSRRG